MDEIGWIALRKNKIRNNRRERKRETNLDGISALLVEVAREIIRRFTGRSKAGEEAVCTKRRRISGEKNKTRRGKRNKEKIKHEMSRMNNVRRGGSRSTLGLGLSRCSSSRGGSGLNNKKRWQRKRCEHIGRGKKTKSVGANRGGNQNDRDLKEPIKHIYLAHSRRSSLLACTQRVTTGTLDRLLGRTTIARWGQGVKCEDKTTEDIKYIYEQHRDGHHEHSLPPLPSNAPRQQRILHTLALIAHDRPCSEIRKGETKARGEQNKIQRMPNIPSRGVHVAMVLVTSLAHTDGVSESELRES